MARVVLVADDSPTIQKKALGILKGEGFEVETVSNGVAAIKRLSVIHPVVVLADVSMPGRDGYEVCEFIKKSPELSHVPVLLVASDMEPFDDARGAEVGADGIIKKPFEARDLISIVVKFAEQFEASLPKVLAPLAPSVAPEPVPEFAVPGEGPDETPTVMQHETPDFSTVFGGVAFSEPAAEEAPGYPPAPLAAETVAPYIEPQAEAEITLDPASAPEFFAMIPAPEPPSAPAAETSLAAEEPAAPNPLASPLATPAAPEPEHLDGLETAAAEPVFTEEQPVQATEPPSASAEMHTMVFHTPMETAAPVWKDETIPAPPEPEAASPAALEPQVEGEAPGASSEVPVEQPPESPHIAPSVAVTSLDSFSLDDATAGQVHFGYPAAEVGPVDVDYSAPAGEAPATEIAPLESAPEAAYAENALPDGPLESAFTENATPEAPQQAVITEADRQEPAPEAASTEIASHQFAPEPASPELPVEAAAPAPAYDWPLIYTVVHKVVVRMSPPPLPMEAVEEIARRLAIEIATEISSESSQPPA